VWACYVYTLEQRETYLVALFHFTMPKVKIDKMAVCAYYRDNRDATHDKIAEVFNVTRPTISRALKKHFTADGPLPSRPRFVPFSPFILLHLA